MAHRLNLTPVALEHVSLIHAAIRENVAEYFYRFKNIDETRAWVTEAIQKHNEGIKEEFMVFSGDTFVGMISPAFVTPHEAEIGLWIVPEMQGQGYGVATLQEIIPYLRTRGVTKLIYETDAHNKPSILLATTLGFTEEKSNDGLKFTLTI